MCLPFDPGILFLVTDWKQYLCSIGMDFKNSDDHISFLNKAEFPLSCLYNQHLPELTQSSSSCQEQRWQFLWLSPFSPRLPTFVHIMYSNSSHLFSSQPPPVHSVPSVIFSLSLGTGSSHQNWPLFKYFLSSKQPKSPPLLCISLWLLPYSYLPVVSLTHSNLLCPPRSTTTGSFKVTSDFCVTASDL